MTDFETKELALFKEWYNTVDKLHKHYKLQYEEAWLARAKLNERQTTLTSKDSSSN